jgi:hypothetical protein
MCWWVWYAQVEAELTSSDEHWLEVAKGCAVCCHVASPFPLSKPKHEDDLIKPVRLLPGLLCSMACSLACSAATTNVALARDSEMSREMCRPHHTLLGVDVVTCVWWS